jgi:RimJ/RimL family protein N-acetyltransferase
LTPASSNDLDRLCELLWLADVRHFLCDGHTLPRDVISTMLERAAHFDGAVGLWMIESQLDGYVGYCGIEDLTVPPAIHPTVGSGFHLQIALHPRAWGRGLARQVIEALTDYALHDYGLERVLAGVYETNERAHRLMLRCHFLEIARLLGPKLVIYERRE